jgi:hypothetical protein
MAGVALPVYAGLNGLHGFGATIANDYPVRFELPSARRAVATDVAISDFTNAKLIQALADTSSVDRESAAITSPDAFAGLVTRSEQLPAAASPASSLLAISFDLSDPSAATDNRDGGGTLDARKSVRLDGVDVGTTAIRITSGSALFIARDDLRNLLTASGREDLAARITGGERSAAFVSFDEIRRLGFGVRYDPVSDRILVST